MRKILKTGKSPVGEVKVSLWLPDGGSEVPPPHL